MKKIMIILLIILGITGCANTGSIKPEQKAEMHSIAVVSLLEDKLDFTKVGVFVFNNDSFTLDMPNWAIDNAVEKTIQNELQHTLPQIKIVSLNFNRSELLKLYAPTASFAEYVDLKRIESELANTLKVNSVNALILIHKELDKGFIHNKSVFLKGNGVYYGSYPFSIDSVLKPHTYFDIVVLDSKTLKPIVRKQVRSVSTNFGKTKISWDNQLKSNLSESMLSEFQSDLNSLIMDNMKSGLKEMGL